MSAWGEADVAVERQNHVAGTGADAAVFALGKPLVGLQAVDEEAVIGKGRGIGACPARWP
ncbi:MAG: hypothetical protein ACNI3A_10620 [Desulfovibrio sp.]|uniref:hypothetical protein n=1 Tax=Desulfovibrio sp. 7SRBS1 TaxID=3378064 RepID=UPI003B405443